MDSSSMTLAPLIERVYAAAVDPGLWPDTLDALGKRFHAPSSCIFLHDFGSATTRQDVPDASLSVTTGFETAAWNDFVEHYCKVNVWTLNESTLASGTAVTSSMLYPDDALSSTEFYAEWLRPQDLFYALGGVVDRQESVALKVSFLRSKGQGGFDAESLRDWQRLIPHVQRAADLHRRLTRATQRARDAESALSMLSTGVALVSRTRQVRLLNAAGEALLQGSRGLHLDRTGRLIAVSPAANDVLQQHLRYALWPWTLPGAAGTRPRSIRFEGQGGAVHASIVPLPDSGDRIDAGASVAIFLADPNGAPSDITGQLESLYGLTRAEARLVSALVQGMTLGEYAETRNLSASTVRTQLRRATDKVGVRRQADLVRVVLSGLASLR